MANLLYRIAATTEGTFRVLPCASKSFLNSEFDGVKNVPMGRNIADFN